MIAEWHDAFFLSRLRHTRKRAAKRTQCSINLRLWVALLTQIIGVCHVEVLLSLTLLRPANLAECARAGKAECLRLRAKLAKLPRASKLTREILSAEAACRRGKISLACQIGARKACGLRVTRL